MWNTGDRVPDGYVLASDGLPARDQGAWARDKLLFLDEYQGPALGATKKKQGETYYIDLFAGPGMNVSREGGPTVEFPGSPIRALAAEFSGKDGGRSRFRGYYFCNLSKLDHELLEKRLAPEIKRLAIDPTIVHNLRGDANDLVKGMLRDIPAWAYLLVFADIEGVRQLPFSTLRLLKKRHSSVDLYVLYPCHIGMYRTMPYDVEEGERMKPTLDAYFGTDAWQSILSARQTSSQRRAAQHGLRQLYLDQLRTVWRHAKVVKPIRKAGGRFLYDMMFAFDHEAAGNISESASGRSDQLRLFDGKELD